MGGHCYYPPGDELLLFLQVGSDTKTTNQKLNLFAVKKIDGPIYCI
jgi:hypothetical protein